MDGPRVTALWLLNRSTTRPGALNLALKAAVLGIHSSSLISEQSWSTWEQVFWLGDMAFTAFFTFDVAFRILVLQRKFWRRHEKDTAFKLLWYYDIHDII